MNEITITNKNGRLTVSSLQVATDFGKQHKYVLEFIDELKKGVAEKSADLFIEKTYQEQAVVQVLRYYP